MSEFGIGGQGKALKTCATCLLDRTTKRKLSTTPTAYAFETDATLQDHEKRLQDHEVGVLIVAVRYCSIEVSVVTRGIS